MCTVSCHSTYCSLKRPLGRAAPLIIVIPSSISSSFVGNSEACFSVGSITGNPTVGEYGCKMKASGGTQWVARLIATTYVIKEAWLGTCSRWTMEYSTPHTPALKKKQGKHEANFFHTLSIASSWAIPNNCRDPWHMTIVIKSMVTNSSTEVRRIGCSTSGAWDWCSIAVLHNLGSCAVSSSRRLLSVRTCPTQMESSLQQRARGK